jgi:hypothetical protein
MSSSLFAQHRDFLQAGTFATHVRDASIGTPLLSAAIAAVWADHWFRCQKRTCQKRQVRTLQWIDLLPLAGISMVS